MNASDINLGTVKLAIMFLKGDIFSQCLWPGLQRSDKVKSYFLPELIRMNETKLTDGECMGAKLFVVKIVWGRVWRISNKIMLWKVFSRVSYKSVHNFFFKYNWDPYVG